MTDHKQIHPLLQTILSEAKRRGLNQKGVAEKAEMAPESLSRIIRTGRMELATLERLAKAVGLDITTAPLLTQAAPAEPTAEAPGQ